MENTILAIFILIFENKIFWWIILLIMAIIGIIKLEEFMNEYKRKDEDSEEDFEDDIDGN